MIGGQEQLHAARLRVRFDRLASSSLSFSTSDLPTAMPRALKNVYAMAPPMIRRSTLPSMFLMTSILSDTFAPPMIATNGRSGDSSAWPRYLSSCSIKRPAAGFSKSRVIASTDACARCAAPNASLT
jgi:hypothetical protein